MPQKRGGLRAIFMILAVLVPVIAGFVGLYLLYVTNQTASITRRNYRLLVAASRELSNHADEVRATASTNGRRGIARKYWHWLDERLAKVKRLVLELPATKEVAEEFKQVLSHDELYIVESIVTQSESGEADEEDVPPPGVHSESYQNFCNDSTKRPTVVLSPKDDTYIYFGYDPFFDTELPTLAFQGKPPPERKSVRCSHASLSEALEGLLERPFAEPFAGFIVTDAANGTVVAQTTSVGGGITALQDLFDAAAHERGETAKGASQAQPEATPAASPTVRAAPTLPHHVLAPGHVESVRYMNDEFLLYCVPTLGELRIVKDGDPAGSVNPKAPDQLATLKFEEGSLALCGLVSERRFRKESGSMPPALLAAVSVVMIVALLCWPLLRLRFMGPHERLRAADAITSVLSYLVLVAGVSFVLLDAHFYVTLRADFDDQLHQVSVQVRDRLRSEIQGGRQQLRAVIEEFEKGYMPQGHRLSLKYWSFERVVPIGVSGSAMFGWEAKPVSSTHNGGLTWQLNDQPKLLATSVKDREYFEDAMGGRWWLPGGTSRGNCGDRFTAEILRTRSTGDYSLVLAVPMKPCEETAPDLWVMSTKLEPFLDAVLPEGFRFAILDAKGQVKLGSLMNQAWGENFLRETGEDRMLRAALKTRSAQTISTVYYAKRIRMYVHPIADTPWSLVVYYDLRLLRAMNFELITSWLVISTFLLLIYTVSIALFFWFLPGYRARWLWPRREAAAVKLYWLASVALVATALAAYWALTLSDGPDKLIAVLLLPAFATSLTAVCLGTNALQSSKERKTFIAAGVVALVVPALVAVSAGTGAIPSALAALGVPAVVAVLGNRPTADFTWPAIGLALLVCACLSSRFLSRDERGWAQDGVRRAGGDANSKKRLSPEFRLRWSYCLMPIAFTISVAVMPTFVIFMDARDHEIRNLTKLGQHYWLESMLRRARNLPNRKNPADAELASAVRNEWLEYSQDLYPSSWLGGALLKIGRPPSNSKPPDAPEQVSGRSTATQTANARAGLQSMTALIQPILPLAAYGGMGSESDYAAELREMTADAAADDSWRWTGNGEDLRIRVNAPSIETALGASNHTATTPLAARSDGEEKAIQKKRRSDNDPWLGFTPVAVLLAASIMVAVLWWLAKVVTLSDIGRVAERVSALSITSPRAEPSPSEIWPGLTPLEKLVLIHVAEEGFLSRKQMPVAQKLYDMGLIRFDPALSLRDEALRDYVVKAPDREVVVALEREDRSAGWANAKVVIAGSLLALAGFLFVTQPNLIGYAIAILTGVGALVPLISRLLGGFTLDRKSSGS